MEAVIRHSINRAIDEAVILWTFSSAQFPINNSTIMDGAHGIILNSLSIFAINARRSLETLPREKKFTLDQSRWKWGTAEQHEHVGDLFDGLNRIIHANRLDVGFVRISKEMAVIEGGAVVVPFIKAKTDRRAISFIDLFALSYSFLYKVVPELQKNSMRERASDLH